MTNLCIQEEDDEMKHLVNLELERRAATAEEELKQKKKEMRHKEDLITTLRQQVEHYESQLSECEVRMKSVEEELQKQIASLHVTVCYTIVFLVHFQCLKCNL